ncbi:pyruvate formate lyase family protein [Escherichia coli]
MVIGKQMQFFGARANLAKRSTQLTAGWTEAEDSGRAKTAPLMDDVLDYDKVMDSLDHFMDWRRPCHAFSALNIIHYMHDKYGCEAR